jgi:hypothetical protein
MSFRKDYASMNLEPIFNAENNETISYKYADQYSQVMYKHLENKDDKQEIGFLSIYTRRDDNSEWGLEGIISDNYKFIGNNVVIDGIKNSLGNISKVVFLEKPFMSSNLTYMYNEILVQNVKNMPGIGDVYPHFTIINSYNGFAAVSVLCGFSILENNNIKSSFSFKNKLMKMRQVHFSGSNTSMSYAMDKYINIFNNNIIDMINMNMSNPLSEEDMLKSLELIEILGKKKRDEISAYLAEIGTGGEMTTWKMFQAISKFSVESENINAKKVLENVIERTLILPQNMLESLENINR